MDTMHAGLARPGRDAAAWAAIGALIAMVALADWRVPLPITPQSLAGVALACTALGGAALFYRTVRPRPEFAAMCTALAQMILFTAFGIVLSYLLARHGGPLWDARLDRWDRALGFDWLAYVRWVDSSAALTAVFRFAYASLIPQIICLVLALGFARRLAQLRAVMLAAILSGIATILISALFPAVSNFVRLGLRADDFDHVDPVAGYVHLAHFTALRNGTIGPVALGDMQGIITFPSYHAALSLVMLWGFWLTARSWLRWPGMLLAALTIAATPVDGGHYLVDVIAGCAIAVLCILAAPRLIHWAPARASLTAWPFRRSHAASAR